MSLRKNGEWTFSRGGEYFNEGEYFDTKEAAIAFGNERYEGLPFYVGQIETVGLGVGVDVSAICEHINQNMVDEVGEAAEGYLMDTKQEHDDELEQEIIDVIIKWIERYGYQPTFFKVVNVQKIE